MLASRGPDRVSWTLSNSSPRPRLLTLLYAPFAAVFRHPHLTWQLTKHEISKKYRGSVLGVLWSFLTPVVMLSIFTFVFSIVFQLRWNRDIGGKGQFAIVLFAGFIVFWFFSDCVNRAPGLILENRNFVKKVVFPLETLIWALIFTSLFHTAISLLVLLLFHAVVFGVPHLQVAWFPFVLLPFCLFSAGICSFLAALGVYYRDIGHLVNVGLTVLMYTSPIIFPLEAVPSPYRPIIEFNPLTFVVTQSRKVLLWGESPDWLQLVLYTALSWGIAVAGHVWFSKTRKGFASVL